MIKKEELRIIYMGTPDFAVAPLKRLVENGYKIVGVVTMPDKPVGRHQNKLTPSPVKVYAEEHGLTLLQPERLKDETFLEALRSLRADLQIVVAFRMLPEVVWNMPRLGTFNLHASLLPQYRGAAPINWAIIQGEKETGITTFFLDHEIDTGKIIHRRAVPILEEDNAESVHDKLMVLGAELVQQTVDDILADNVTPLPQIQLQGDKPLQPAPKIFKETCRIDWTKDVQSTYDFIRGLSPYPAAWTTLHHDGKTSSLKIFASVKEYSPVDEPVGTVLTDGKTYLKISQSDGWQSVKVLQIEGKRRMNTADFLRGFHSEGHLYVE